MIHFHESVRAVPSVVVNPPRPPTLVNFSGQVLLFLLFSFSGKLSLIAPVVSLGVQDPPGLCLDALSLYPLLLLLVAPHCNLSVGKGILPAPSPLRLTGLQNRP